jgi:hypothetical protein
MLADRPAALAASARSVVQDEAFASSLSDANAEASAQAVIADAIRRPGLEGFHQRVGQFVRHLRSPVSALCPQKAEQSLAKACHDLARHGNE